MIKVSVIIPVYNTEKHLKQCLKSVVSQSLYEIEIIVVNDCSPDASDLIINEIANSDSRLVCLKHQQNQGLPTARNTGMKAAKGKYLIHLDSDDYWISRNTLSDLFHTAETEGCDILRFNGLLLKGNNLSQDIIKQADFINAKFHQQSELWNYRSVFLFFFRRQFLVENNLEFFPKISIGEDQIFLSSTLPLSGRVSSLSKPFYAYRVDNSSMMRRTWALEDYLEESNSAKLVSKNLLQCDAAWRKFWAFRLNYYWSAVLMSKACQDLDPKQQLTVIEDALSILTIEEINKLLVNGGLNKIGVAIALSLKSKDVQKIKKTLSLVGSFSLLANRPTLRRIRAVATRYYWNVRRLFHAIKRRTLIKQKIYDREFINTEGFKSHNFTLRANVKPKGVSAMLRIKNEEVAIASCLESIIFAFDEIVVIDNASTDKTVALVNKFAEENPLGFKIKLHHYQFSVARCGADHQATGGNSLHSLSYYYNWCLSKCSFNNVCKWDADMQITSDTNNKTYLKKYLDAFKSRTGLSVGKLPVQTVYIDQKKNFISSIDEVHDEVRLFTNNPAIYFTKGKDWEVLSYDRARQRNLKKTLMYEIKNVEVDEFSHWSSDTLLTPRKVKEYRNFMLVKSNLHLMDNDSFQKVDQL